MCKTRLGTINQASHNHTLLSTTPTNHTYYLQLTSYTVHFLYPKLGSFSDMEYYFYQIAYRDSKVPKRFVGLNQMQCSPSFDWNWGKKNDPIACWHQLHPQFQVLQLGKCLGYPPEHVGGVTETANCMGSEGAARLPTPINRRTPPFKFPLYSLFIPKGGINISG